MQIAAGSILQNKIATYWFHRMKVAFCKLVGEPFISVKLDVLKTPILPFTSRAFYGTTFAVYGTTDLQ